MTHYRGKTVSEKAFQRSEETHTIYAHTPTMCSQTCEEAVAAFFTTGNL